MCTTNASGTTNLPFCYEVVLEKPIDRVTQAVEFLVSSDRDEAGIIIIRNREKRKENFSRNFFMQHVSSRQYCPFPFTFLVHSRIPKVVLHPTH